MQLVRFPVELRSNHHICPRNVLLTWRCNLFTLDGYPTQIIFALARCLFVSMPAKVIHDNVWGDILVSELALSIVNSPEFQRLHFIHQTGCAFKVFPTARTSRFEHSLGAYYVTGLLLEHIFQQQPDVKKQIPYDPEWIKIAALCHDIGHGPFSHSFDKALGTHHEERSVTVTRSILERIQCSTEMIESVVTLIDPPSKKLPWYATLVKNKCHGIDVDKLDYIPRDNLAFGLKLNVDVNRIIRNTLVVDDELCFCDRIKDEIFNLFFVRYRLHRDVYSHPKVLALDILIQEIIRTTCKDFQLSWTDVTVLAHCPDTSLVRLFTEGRGRWRLTSGENTIPTATKIVKVNPSFYSEGVQGHPLSKVQVFSRKTQTLSKRYLETSEYSIFARGPVEEELEYSFHRID